MNAIGLWAIAADTPDATAVIEPDGTPVTYAGLAGLADRYGRRGAPMLYTQLGHPVVLMDRWDAMQALALIERHHVTHTHAVPGSQVRVLDGARRELAAGQQGLVYLRMGPSQFSGEEIKAVVQPAAGASGGAALTADLLAFLGGRVARFKLPKTIDYVAELPRDPNGKLYKRKLRDPYWEGRDRAI